MISVIVVQLLYLSIFDEIDRTWKRCAFIDIPTEVLETAKSVAIVDRRLLLSINNQVEVVQWRRQRGFGGFTNPIWELFEKMTRNT